MIEDKMINMLKKSLEKANVPKPESSDIDSALMTVVCVNVLIKNKIVKAESIFSKFEMEKIKDFIEALGKSKINGHLFIERNLYEFYGNATPLQEIIL